MTFADDARALRLAVVGALSLEGKELGRSFTVTGIPLADVVLIGEPDQEGTITELDGEPAVVRDLTEVALIDVDAIVCCSGSVRLAPFVAGAVRRGTTVIDLTGGLAGVDGATVRLPGLGSTSGSVHLLPHPLATIATLLLRRLAQVTDLLRVELTGVMPVAEVGEPGIDELYAQTVERLSFRDGPTDALGERIAFDVRVGEASTRRALESRLRTEMSALLAGDLPSWTATVLRVPVFLGVGGLLSIELDQELPAAAIVELLDEDDSILVVRGQPVSPGALDEHTDPDETRVVVSVLDGDPPGRIRLWAVADLVRVCRVGPAIGLLAELTQIQAADS